MADGASGRRIILGRLSGIYGIRGWLKLVSHTDPRENVFTYQPWLLGKGGNGRGAAWSEVAFADYRSSGKSLTVKLPGIDDREAACALVGSVLAVSRERLPEPQPGEYYWADLMGMKVVALDGEPLGRVVDMQATGANDVLIVQGATRRVIPFVVGQVVREVDQDAARITVDWEWD